MKKIKSALICGLGSSGHRHMKNLRILGCDIVNSYSTGKGSIKKYDQPPDFIFNDLHKALECSPDLVIISNPTSMHVGAAIEAVNAGCNVLIEKPISNSIKDCNKLIEISKKNKVYVRVAYNLRFHPTMIKLKQWVSSKEPLGAPLVARAHVGGWLPGWHPWEDYKKSYASRLDLGGGAALTNSHEIDLALWMFGEPITYNGISSDINKLGTNVDEASCFSIKHNSGVISSITLSFTQQPETRIFEISFEKGVAIANLDTSEITVLHKNGKVEKIKTDTFTKDQTYREQLLSFDGLLCNNNSEITTVNEAISVMNVAMSIVKG